MFLVPWILWASMLWSVAVAAQQDPMSSELVPPEVIMEHQRALAITEEQREQIKRVVADAQRRFTELQWDLQAEMERFGDHLSDRESAEEVVLAQLDRVLELETKIKRTQVSMLLALRRLLTPQQFDEALRLQQESGPSPEEIEFMRRVQQQLRQRNDARPNQR